MAKLPYMPFYPNDYLADNLVSALSAGAQGCYVRILCHLWNGREPYLPNDAVKLAKIIGFPYEEFLSYWKEIQADGFEILNISKDGSKVTQKRLLKEWQKAQGKSAALSYAANKRWHKEVNTDVMQKDMHLHNECNDNQNQNQNQIQNQNYISEPEPKETKTGAGNCPALAVPVDKPVDNCPTKQIIELYHEVLPELPQVREWAEASRKMLVSRWREKKERQSLDWWRDYFQKVKESNFLTGKTEGRNGNAPFVASLEWLVRPTNLAKVLNWNYANRKAKNMFVSAAEKGYDECMKDFYGQFGLNADGSDMTNGGGNGGQE